MDPLTQLADEDLVSLSAPEPALSEQAQEAPLHDEPEYVEPEAWASEQPTQRMQTVGQAGEALPCEPQWQVGPNERRRQGALVLGTALIVGLAVHFLSAGSAPIRVPVPSAPATPAVKAPSAVLRSTHHTAPAPAPAPAHRAHPQARRDATSAPAVTSASVAHTPSPEPTPPRAPAGESGPESWPAGGECARPGDLGCQ